MYLLFLQTFRTLPGFEEKYGPFDKKSSSTSLFSFRSKKFPSPSDVISRGELIIKPCLTKGNAVIQRHYGITVRIAFNDEIHSEEDRCWNSLEECWVASNQIHWLMHKNVTRAIEWPTAYTVSQSWREDGPTRIHLQVHAFEGRVAPTSLGPAGSMDAVKEGETMLDTVIDIGDKIKLPELIPRTNSQGVKVELRHKDVPFFVTDLAQ
ncbi:hypothetical protein BDW42DRAFT_195139 [Aspergillus taichungensis]|uniref:Uncharacterized protein n=1 Tax=Aspergillus taichungensis TaxID=482145 RepID=A0A2J5HQK2_9EURO|nr:hypothetical protein BDW42DRAFT_195139 [Aspergillus taichungensis]